MTAWTDVHPEHEANVGWREGPNNQNPWGPEQGVFNAAYCCSAASIVPYHHGVRWWSDCQFGQKGCAYCPYLVKAAQTHGNWKFDTAAQSADLLPGDLVLFDWGGDGVADHVETAVAIYADGTFDTIGYNTGSPNGCHLIRRNRTYLLGRVRMQGVFYVMNPTPGPVIPGGKMQPDFNPPVHLNGNVVSTYFPAGHAGGYLFTDAGYVYGFGDYPGYHGAPVALPAANWQAGHRVGAKIEASPVGGTYRCWDTNSEFYDF